MSSIRLGNVYGIPIELHSTFVLVAVLVIALLVWRAPEQLLFTILFFLFLFGSVLIHELFHSIVAVRKGFKVERIILLPIGGVSIAEAFPENPWDEFKIAIAGPAFNFLVVGIILAIVAVFPGVGFPTLAELMASEDLLLILQQSPLFTLFYVNLILGAFNLLLPAVPLDGGRIFRSLVATQLGFLKATQIASKVSVFFSIALFLLGLLGGNIFMVVVAAFVFFGARMENEAALYKEYLKHVNLRALIQKNPKTIPARYTVQQAFDKMQKENQSHYLVKENKKWFFVGVESLSSAPKKAWAHSSIRQWMKPLPIVLLSELRQSAFNQLVSKGNPFLGVQHQGKFSGVLSESAISQSIQIARLKAEAKN